MRSYWQLHSQFSEHCYPTFCYYRLFCCWDFVAAPVQFSLCTGHLVQQLGSSRERVYSAFKVIAPRQFHPCVLSRGWVGMVCVWSCAIKGDLSKWECPVWRLRAEDLILPPAPARWDKGDFQLHCSLPHSPGCLDLPLDFLMSLFNIVILNFFT